MFLSILIFAKVEHILLLAGKIMPGAEKLSGELLFPKEKKRLLFSTCSNLTFPQTL